MLAGDRAKRWPLKIRDKNAKKTLTFSVAIERIICSWLVSWYNQAAILDKLQPFTYISSLSKENGC